MITFEERELLKEACAGKPELLPILARVPAICRCCATCGHREDCFCSKHEEEIPDKFDGPCDEWDFNDVPF